MPISDCSFDSVVCRRWGLWDTAVSTSIFSNADLRNSSLGGWRRGPNRCEALSLVGVDMRDIESWEAYYTDVDFSHARLDSVDFGSSSFVPCTFAGTLNEVVFWRRMTAFASLIKKQDPNPMEDVDFSKTVLRWCSFSGIDLRTARLRSDDDHLVLDRFGCVLRTALATLEGDSDPGARGVVGLLRNELPFVQSDDDRNILNRQDIHDTAGAAAERVLGVIAAAARECAR